MDVRPAASQLDPGHGGEGRWVGRCKPSIIFVEKFSEGGNTWTPSPTTEIQVPTLLLGNWGAEAPFPVTNIPF